MDMNKIEKGLPVWVQLHKGRAKVVGTILDYAFSSEGNYLQCLVELELPNPLVPGQVLHQIYPQPLQSYKLSSRKNATTSTTQVLRETPVSTQTSAGHTIYTIGYGIEATERHAASSQLTTFLKQPTPGIIIDIRFTPYSKLAGWNREDLEAFFSTRYIHIVELGNKHHHTGEEIELVDEESGLQQAEAWLKQFDICFLCGCYRVPTCHRAYVAERLSQRTHAPVCHLLQQGTGRYAEGLTRGEEQTAPVAQRSTKAKKKKTEQSGPSLWTPDLWQ